MPETKMTPTQKVEKLEGEKKRRQEKDRKEKAMMSRMGHQVGGDVGALLFVGLTTLLFTKVPRAQSFDAAGKVRVRAVLMVPMYLGGLIGGDHGVAIAIRDTGLMWIGAEIDRWVSNATWAQPKLSP